MLSDALFGIVQIIQGDEPDPFVRHHKIASNSHRGLSGALRKHGAAESSQAAGAKTLHDDGSALPTNKTLSPRQSKNHDSAPPLLLITYVKSGSSRGSSHLDASRAQKLIQEMNLGSSA